MESLYGNYYNYNSPSFGSILAGLGVYLLIVLIISIIMLVALWKVFKKAGRNGWEAIIPIYNFWVLFEIGGQKGAYIFFILIPCVGPVVFLVYEIKAILEIAKRFGKGTGFGVLMIFFPVITYPILAFSSARYLVPEAEVQSSILDVDTQGVSADKSFNYGYDSAQVSNQASSEPVISDNQVQSTDFVQQVVNQAPTEQVNTVATEAEFNSSVDRFHTPSALDKKE